MHAFQEYFTKLYKADDTASSSRALDFLQGLPIPTLSAQHRADMEAPILEEEVQVVIKNLETRSAPGPDGFLAIYYKAFPTPLAPYFVKFFNSLRSGNPIDRTLNAALLKVIPKPGNYRAIFRINKDIKIFTKILTDYHHL